MDQDGPKMARDGSKMAQDTPKMAQDSPEMAPYAHNTSPRSRQTNTKTFWRRKDCIIVRMTGTAFKFELIFITVLGHHWRAFQISALSVNTSIK